MKLTCLFLPLLLLMACSSTAASSSSGEACEGFNKAEGNRCYVEARAVTRLGTFFSVVPGDGKRHIFLSRQGIFELVYVLPEVDYFDARIFLLSKNGEKNQNVLIVEDHYLESEESENVFQWHVIDLDRRKRLVVISAAEPPDVVTGETWWLINAKQYLESTGEARVGLQEKHFCIFSDRAFETTTANCSSTSRTP